MSTSPYRSLADVAAELRAAVPGAPGVDTLAHDFSAAPTDAGVARLVAACAERDVGVLVNNVGASYPSALYFHEVEGVEPGLTRSMVATNVHVRARSAVLALRGTRARHDSLFSRFWRPTYPVLHPSDVSLFRLLSVSTTLFLYPAVCN